MIHQIPITMIKATRAWKAAKDEPAASAWRRQAINL